MFQITDDIRHDARWLRGLRKRLGMSTKDLAEAVVETASSLNDRVDLKQQTVSAFENGSHKSIPRWLGYAQLVFLQRLNDQALTDNDAYDLRLPEESERFFDEVRRRAGFRPAFEEFFDDEAQSEEDRLKAEYLSDRERSLIQVLRELDANARDALFRIVFMVGDASESARATVHSAKQGYKAG